jgi:glycosyltransferase involved in cell wall biosynthesis
MISVLLATYNWPQALKLCLESLATQTDRDFEIIIADDGSTDSTKEIIDHFRASHSIAITHLWQDDQGFRKTKILNEAIVHRSLSQQGFLVTGSRVLLNEKLTQELLSWDSWSFSRFAANLLVYRLSGSINKYWPLKIQLGDGKWRNYQKFVWRRIKGCNMACWKSDATAIHGFDETMTGWGHEDADFVFRLQRNHIQRKSGAWATEVLHLFHKIHDQSNAAENAKRVREKILAKAT